MREQEGPGRDSSIAHTDQNLREKLRDMEDISILWLYKSTEWNEWKSATCEGMMAENCPGTRKHKSLD